MWIFWLVFDSNAGGPGSGASYTPPQLLIGNEATTTKPEDPVRRGYTFTGWNTKADGTGTWWYKTDGSVNRLETRFLPIQRLYAQWEAKDTDYYVVFGSRRLLMLQVLRMMPKSMTMFQVSTEQLKPEKL